MDNIKTEKDIIKELAEELNMSERVVANIVSSSIDFFHDQTENNEKMLTFGFRNLCSFQANLRMMLGKRKTNEVVEARYNKLIEVDATSRHVDLPLAWVLYRNHASSEFKKKRENEEDTFRLPNLNWVYSYYYEWLKKAEIINNEKVARYFK